MPRPRGTKERTVGFDKTTDGTGTSILQSALRRQQKKMEKEEGKALRDLHRKQKKEDGSVANLEYLESLHKRAKRKRQKDQESTEALPPHDLPPKDRPPQDRPPDPPPPFRDKETSREKSRLVTGPHETVPPRSDSQHKKKKGRGNQGEPMSLMQPQPLSYVHPFAPTLLEWEKGIQVDCGPEWDMATCEAAVDRGPHPSAMTAEAAGGDGSSSSSSDTAWGKTTMDANVNNKDDNDDVNMTDNNVDQNDGVKGRLRQPNATSNDQRMMNNNNNDESETDQLRKFVRSLLGMHLLTT